MALQLVPLALIAQEKEFKELNELIVTLSRETTIENNRDLLLELSNSARQLERKYPESPLGSYSKSFYYSITKMNVDSAFFLMKSAYQLFEHSDEKTKAKLCNKFSICSDSLSKTLNSLSIASFQYYSTNIEKLDIYLRIYPADVIGYQLAKDKQIEMSFEKITRTINEYNYFELSNSFIQKFPNSIYNDSILRIVEKIEFQSAKTKNTIQTYDDFKIKYPNSKYIQEVDNLIDEIDFKIAIHKNTIEGYELYLANHQNSIKKTKIEELLSSAYLKLKTFNNLKTKEECVKFISENRNTDLANQVAKWLSTLETLESKMSSAKSGQKINLNYLPPESKTWFIYKYLEYVSWVSNFNSWSNDCTNERFGTLYLNPNRHKFSFLGRTINSWYKTQCDSIFLLKTNEKLTELYSMDKNLDVKECILFYSSHFKIIDSVETTLNQFLKELTEKTNEMFVEVTKDLKEIRNDFLQFEDSLRQSWAFNDTIKIPLFKEVNRPEFYDFKSLKKFNELGLFDNKELLLKIFLPNEPIITLDIESNSDSNLVVAAGKYTNLSHFSKDLDGFVVIAEKTDQLNRIQKIKSFEFEFDNMQMNDVVTKVHMDQSKDIYASIFSEGRNNYYHFENRIVKLNSIGETIWICDIKKDKSNYLSSSKCVFLETDKYGNLYALYCDELTYGGNFHLVKINAKTGKAMWLKEYLGDHLSGILAGGAIVENQLIFLFNFTQNNNFRSVGKPFNPYILICNLEGSEIHSEPILSEEPKLISAIEIKKGSIYATGRKGEIDFGYDFVEKIVLSDKQDQPQTENVFLSAHEQLLKDEYSFMFKSNLNYPYFIEFDFTGKVITTNGGK